MFRAGFFLRLLIYSEDGGNMFLRLAFTGIHGVISQKIELINTFYFSNSVTDPSRGRLGLGAPLAPLSLSLSLSVTVPTISTVETRFSSGVFRP
jgi:hypothetical protein